MRRAAILVVIASIGFTTVAEARDTYVHGYTRKDGTYVEPYHRTAPNTTRLDNYSTYPNVNPYTGQQGTVDPYPVPVYRPYSPPRSTGYQPYVNPYAPKPAPVPCYGYGC